MNYASVLDFDYLNGEGVRVSLWVSGCPHACHNCHNPLLWNPNYGKPFTEKSMKGLLKLLERDMSKDFSVLGGEPLAPYNRDTVTQICKTVKETYPEKNIWLWTGYSYEEVKDLEVMKYVDIVVDGKFIEELKDENLLWRGSSNQRVIDVKTGRTLL